ncbi:MAG TPA: transketolase [Saprospiraceae bacterium]|nr:transketolase [Saprospiraceae bacterium]HMX87386.1 transketolase [Saprospiraceae bacterium]HMZ39213.1 transketolase [Saprospiraceae bacterium]HNA63488.1 transketolase [Saprospiraceae bacterium]HNB31389.1 transketolase [Saprospiraceae bacterium]
MNSPISKRFVKVESRMLNQALFTVYRHPGQGAIIFCRLDRFRLYTFALSNMKTQPELEKIASQIRRDIIRQTWSAKSGHPGGSLGCADMMTSLFFNHLRFTLPFKMEGKDEDVFVLSNGHISPLFYSVLARSGFFPVNELATFRMINSRLQGHPATHEHLPGVRVATGSLGQGLSVALGMALAKRFSGDEHLVYCLTGDGELQEGQNWEAIMAAAHYKADRLIAIVDWNGQQIDGPNDKIISLGDLEAKWLSFGWKVLHANGNSMKEIDETLTLAGAMTGKGMPIVILMKTIMGFGVDFMMGTNKWHGVAPNDEQARLALEQLAETLGDYQI